VAMCRVRAELQPILEQLHVLDKIKHFDDKKVAVGAKW
jgi:hypothetical protein